MKFIQKALIRRGNKYLIGLRSEDAKYYPDHWDLFGGTLEPGEDPAAGVAREVLEETGLRVIPTKVAGVFEFDLDQIGKMTHRFTLWETRGADDEPRLSREHTDYRWATKEEILKLPREPYFDRLFASD